MTAIKERDPDRPIRYGGRPPRVTDDAILALLYNLEPDGGTLRDLSDPLGMERSSLAYRLGCLELEGVVTRRRTGGGVGDRWKATA